ncbi:hypothetical protein OSB04_012373 [Centaurea solstitialis]|uniref:Uncharacterized protein n=1 Tax=Centaurea solstitialis TaxID=347529 RepID=A0AA38TB90_9ASTR|nr:hypothetical protein OSB04_012373 [Centaurea solstitialis]
MNRVYRQTLDRTESVERMLVRTKLLMLQYLKLEEVRLVLLDACVSYTGGYTRRLQGSSGDCRDKVFGVQNSNRHSRFAAKLCETLILMPSGGVKEMMGIAMHHFLGSEDRLLVVENEARCGRYVESCSTSLKLRKCLEIKQHIVLLDEIKVEESLSYVESPIAVLRLRNKKSSTEKVQGQHRKESEWIREQEAEMLEKYRDFSQIDFGDEIRKLDFN